MTHRSLAVQVKLLPLRKEAKNARTAFLVLAILRCQNPLWSINSTVILIFLPFQFQPVTFYNRFINPAGVFATTACSTLSGFTNRRPAGHTAVKLF
jgi:hypothetical protein